VRTLDTLKVGERVRLSSDSRVSLFADQDAKLYEIDGPAEIQLSPKGVLANGKAVEARKLDDAYRNVKVNGSELVQGSMVMRSVAQVRVIGPEGVVTADAARRFAWSQRGAVRFELATQSGDVIFRASAREGSLTLPTSVVLDAGTRYVWGILPLHGGTTPLDWTEFTVAASESGMSPPANNASPTEKVLYAAWLKANGMERASLRAMSTAAP
jgi:hypothetical protein